MIQVTRKLSCRNQISYVRYFQLRDTLRDPKYWDLLTLGSLMDGTDEIQKDDDYFFTLLIIHYCSSFPSSRRETRSRNLVALVFTYTRNKKISDAADRLLNP